jgi:glycosyltransferase involved in cell wall biosynthesis
MKKNKIFITAFGFQSDYIREITNAFASFDNEVYLIGSDQHEKENYSHNVKFLNLRGDDSPDRDFFRKIFDLLTYFKKLFKIINEKKIEIIYDPSIWRGILIFFLYIFYRIKRKKIILTVHDILPHGGYSIYNYIIYLIIYKYLANHLIVHTKYLKDQLIERFYISEDKITNAKHGTYNVNNNQKISKLEARDYFNLSKTEFVVLVFGQQYEYKGTHLLLQKYLPNINHNYKLLIYGKGDNSYCKLLIELVTNHNLQDRVKYKFDFIEKDEVELLFKASDLVCLPYLEGSQSGVLFMSYAFGRPVLAADVGNFKYDVVSGLTGEIFEPFNELDFIEKLNKIILNLKDYEENKIKNFALTNYSWKDFASEILEKVYPKLMIKR